MKTSLPSVINTRYGTQPGVKIKIFWSSGTVDYVDKVIASGNIQSTARIGQIGAVTGTQVVLDDTDGSIKSIYNTLDIVGTIVEVYQTYPSVSDILLFRGKMTSNLSWEEGTRQVSISVESTNESEQMEWPYVFGNVIRVPGRVIQEPLRATTKDVEYNSVSSVIAINNGSSFPQATPMTIGIEVLQGYNPFFNDRSDRYLLFNGSFSGDDFTVTLANAPEYTNAVLDTRPLLDADRTDPNIIWLADDSINLLGLFINISGYHANLCYRQEGAKCWLRNPMVRIADSTPQLLPLPLEGLDIDEAVASFPSRWGKAYLDNGQLALLDSWKILAGANVWDISNPNTVYVVNQVQSVSVVQVLAWRKSTPDTEPTLQPVPSSYFTIDLTGPTTITFDYPLDLRANEGWQSEIFAAVRSTLSGNTATGIKWVIDNKTNLTSDTTTFSDVANDIDTWKSNFATLEDKDSLTLATEMAWQARCAIFESQGLLKIKYLSKVPTSVHTYNQANVEFQSFNGTLSDYNDVVTKLTVEYSDDYADEPKEYIYEYGILDRGYREDSTNMYIYTHLPNVIYSSIFWGFRYANVWRKVDVSGFSDSMILDTFDAATISVPEYSINGIIGEVLDINHNLETLQISATILLASRTVDNISGQPAQNNSFFIPAMVAPSATPDPTTGMALVDYVVSKWPVQNQSEPPEPKTYTLRVTSDTTVIKRGESFSITVTMLSADSVYNTNSSFDIAAISTDPGDSLSISSQTLSSGTWTGNVNISGGSAAGTFTIVASIDNDTITSDPSEQITIDTVGEAVFTFIPSVVKRAVPFTISIANGFPSTEYTLALNITGADTMTPLAVTTNGSGAGSIELTIDNGTDEVLQFTITLSRLGYSTVSDPITLIDDMLLSGDVNGSADANEIATTAIRGLGEVWGKNSAGAWTVELCGTMVRSADRLYPTALSFEVDPASGLELTISRNVLSDPPTGAVNNDDIEVLYKIRDGGIVNSMIAAGTISADKLNFTPGSNHNLDSATHPDVDVVNVQLDDVLTWNSVLSKWINAPALIGKDGMYKSTRTIGLIEGNDILFYNDGPLAADAGSAIGWAYSATRAVSWQNDATELFLADGTYGVGSAPDGIKPIRYKFAAASADRVLTIECRLNFNTNTGVRFTDAAGTGNSADASGIYWNYGTTRKIGWAWLGTGFCLLDGLSSSVGYDGIIPLKYTPNADSSQRKFDIRCILQGNAIDPTEGQILSADASLKPKWIDPPSSLPIGSTPNVYLKWNGTAWVEVGTIDLKVCVAGVTKTYRVPGEDIP